MSNRFIINGKFVEPATAKEARVIQTQYNELCDNREAAEAGAFGSMTNLALNAGFIQQGAKQSVVNEQIDLMYREVDNVPVIERNPSGFQSTLMQLLGSATPVNLGKKVVKKRRVGEAGIAGVSMSGQTDIAVDHTQSDYQSAIIPIFDGAYGLEWRDRLAAQSEGWDQTVDDSREIEKTVYKKADDFLWNGGNLTVEGVTWNGLKGNQQGIAAYSLQVDLTASATTSLQITNEVLAIINVLKITNDCDGPFDLKVSREIMANWRRYGSANDAAFGTIFAMVQALYPELTSISEDPKLSGNQLFVGKFGTDGVHAKSAMAMSSYALPRFKHNDNFDFVKWMAAGFVASETYGGKDCAVYAS